MKRTFMAKGYDGGADESGNRPLITCVRIEYGPAHDRVRVWNRGGCSGELVVNAGDGERFLAVLLPEYRDHIPSLPDPNRIEPIENDATDQEPW